MIAQLFVVEFLLKCRLIIFVFLLQRLVIEVFGMTESRVYGLLCRHDVAAVQGQLGEVALHNVGCLQVSAGLHLPIHGLGLGQRIAADETSRQHLLNAQQLLIVGTCHSLTRKAEGCGVFLHGPMDVGKAGEGLAQLFCAQRVP